MAGRSYSLDHRHWRPIHAPPPPTGTQGTWERPFHFPNHPHGIGDHRSLGPHPPGDKSTWLANWRAPVSRPETKDLEGILHSPEEMNAISLQPQQQPIASVTPLPLGEVIIGLYAIHYWLLFTLVSSEYNLGHLCDHAFRAIHWIMVSLTLKIIIHIHL